MREASTRERERKEKGRRRGGGATTYSLTDLTFGGGGESSERPHNLGGGVLRIFGVRKREEEA